MDPRAQAALFILNRSGLGGEILHSGDEDAWLDKARALKRALTRQALGRAGMVWAVSQSSRPR